MERRTRIRMEFDALTDHLEGTVMDGDGFVLEDMPLPEGCSPPATDVKVVYPDAYPHQPPTVAVADPVSVGGERPRIRAAERGEDGWYRLLLRTWPEWNGETDSGVTVLRLAFQELSEPSMDPLVDR